MKNFKIILGVISAVVLGVPGVWITLFALGGMIFNSYSNSKVVNWSIFIAAFGIPVLLLILIIKKLALTKVWVYLIILVSTFLLSIWWIYAFYRVPIRTSDGSRLANVRQLAQALELYHNDHKAYPNNLTDLTPTYIFSLPETLSPDKVLCENYEFSYTYSSTKTDFRLNFCLQSATGGYSAGVHVLTQDGIK